MIQLVSPSNLLRFWERSSLNAILFVVVTLFKIRKNKFPEQNGLTIKGSTQQEKGLQLYEKFCRALDHIHRNQIQKMSLLSSKHACTEILNASINLAKLLHVQQCDHIPMQLYLA